LVSETRRKRRGRAKARKPVIIANPMKAVSATASWPASIVVWPSRAIAAATALLRRGRSGLWPSFAATSSNNGSKRCATPCQDTLAPAVS
jgi:hypothetical protein